MNAREQILSRIRDALRRTAHRPRVHGAQPLPEGGPKFDFRPILPAVGASFEERRAQFAANSRELKTDFVWLPNPADLENTLIGLRDRDGWKNVGAHSGQLADRAVRALALPTVRTDQPYDVAALERCDAGISECDALVAQTGSVVVSSRGGGGRALSVLPPHHVVLARQEQLVGGLPEAFALLERRYGADYPSMISFITGPSRTGDIERILVLGAHGPRHLTVICVADGK